MMSLASSFNSSRYVEAQRHPHGPEHMCTCPAGHAHVCRPKDKPSHPGPGHVYMPEGQTGLPGTASASESLQLCLQHADNVCPGEGLAVPGEGG